MKNKDKIWKLYERTMQDMETLKYFCKGNLRALKQIDFIEVDLMNLRDEK